MHSQQLYTVYKRAYVVWCYQRRSKALPVSLSSEHEHRLCSILPSHSQRSKCMTDFSQATYLLNALTVKNVMFQEKIHFKTFLCFSSIQYSCNT